MLVLVGGYLLGVSVDSGRSMVPVSLWASLVLEGTPLLSAREPWIVAVEHECQNPVFTPPSPERAPTQDDSYRM